MAHGAAVPLPNLQSIFQGATSQAQADLRLEESQRAVQQRNRIEEVLSGVDLQNREDVIGGLQSVAPQQALEFSQETRGEEAEDFEFAVFVSGRLANVFEQVDDQESFDDAKEFALGVGFPADKVALAGDKFDPQRVADIVAAFRAVDPQALEDAAATFEQPAALPGAREGAGLFQREVPSGRFQPVTGTGVTAGKAAAKFGPLKQLPGAPKGTLAQQNEATGEWKVKAKPVTKKGPGKRGATTAEFNAIASRVASLFQGLYDPRTQTFSFQSKDQAVAALKVLKRAERLFADNEILTPAEAVVEASGPMPGLEENPTRRRRLEGPGAELQDVPGGTQ